MVKKTNGNYDYDAAAEEARRREEERKKRMAELERQITEYDKEREKYYQAREKTVEAINMLDQMAKSLDEAVTCLHENFRIGGANADKGKLDAQIDDITSTAKILKNNTLSDIDTNIENLSKQINSAIAELNGLHTAGESLYPADMPKNFYDDGIINIYTTGTRGISEDGKTYLNFENFTSLFTEKINTANSKITSVSTLVDSIIGIVPSNFTGIGTLKGLGTNFDNIFTNVNKIYSELIEQARQIFAVEEKHAKRLSELEINLGNLKKNYDTKILTNTISNLLIRNTIDAASLTVIILPNLVRKGDLNISDISYITTNLYSNNIISKDDVGNLLYELKRTNMSYSTTKDNMESYEKELNKKYNYKFDYEEHNDDNKNNCWFKIKSNYEYTNDDINIILKPMYDAGIIDADDVREITHPLTVFDKETGSPDIYNNPLYSPHTKDYDIETANGKFKVTIDNHSYEVTDKDRELIKEIKGYETFFTGDEAYDNAIADVAVSDFATAITTKEIGSIKTAVDEGNAVASVGINRTESASWTSSDPEGGGLVAQYIRGDGKQYESYNKMNDDSYLEYINGKTFQTIETAVTDVMNGTRVTDALGFDVDKTGSTQNKITSGAGNNYNYSNGSGKILDPQQDKLVSSTGTIYKRETQENKNSEHVNIMINPPAALEEFQEEMYQRYL